MNSVWTSLEIDIVNHPILQFLVEIHHTKLVQNMQFASPVEVEDAVEGPGMTVEIILVSSREKASHRLRIFKLKSNC